SGQPRSALPPGRHGRDLHRVRVDLAPAPAQPRPLTYCRTAILRNYRCSAKVGVPPAAYTGAMAFRRRRPPADDFAVYNAGRDAAWNIVERLRVGLDPIPAAELPTPTLTLVA